MPFTERHRYEDFETGCAMRELCCHSLKYGTKVETLS